MWDLACPWPFNCQNMNMDLVSSSCTQMLERELWTICPVMWIIPASNFIFLCYDLSVEAMLKLKTNLWKQGKFVNRNTPFLSPVSILLLGIFKVDNVRYKWAGLSGNFLSKIWVLLLAMKKLLVNLAALYTVKGSNFYPTDITYSQQNLLLILFWL